MVTRSFSKNGRERVNLGDGEWFDGVLFQLGWVGGDTKGNGGHDAIGIFTAMPASFTKRLLVNSNT